MFRRYCVPIVMLLLTLGLPTVGCSGAAPAAGGQPRARAERGVIKLGAAISFTGDKAQEGKLYIDAYQHAVDTINAQGGIKVGDTTYTLKLVLEDDGSDATRSARQVEKLINEENVDFLLGPYTSGITFADSAVAEKYHVPMVAGGGASSNIFDRGFKYIFGTLPPAANYFQSILEMAQTLDPTPRSIALLYADDEFDSAVAEGTRALAREMGYRTTIDEGYPSGSPGFGALLPRVEKAAPDIILVAAHAEESVAFVQQARDLKLSAKIMAFTVGPPTPGFRETLGQDAEYIYGVPTWIPALNYEDAAVFGSTAEWVTLFQETYGYEPDYHVASGVADVVVYKAAIEQAGTLDREAVRHAIASINVMTVYGPVAFQENGQIAKSNVAVQIQNGQVVAVYPESIAQRQPIYPMPVWEER